MKKILFTLSAFIFAFGAMAVFSQKADEAKKETKKDKKTIVVYYSYSGNTKAAAQIIQAQLDADIFEIETVKSYPSVYKEVTEQAKKEIKEGYKPEIKNKVNNIAQYDTVVLGSPIWWGTVAPAVSTFMAEHDLAGKTIIPFVTHGGGGSGRSFDDIKKALPKSDILKIGSFYGNSATKKDIENWLKEIK